MAPWLDSTMSHNSWSVWMSSGPLSQRTRCTRGKRREWRDANCLLTIVLTSACTCEPKLSAILHSPNTAPHDACVLMNWIFRQTGCLQTSMGPHVTAGHLEDNAASGVLDPHIRPLLWHSSRPVAARHAVLSLHIVDEQGLQPLRERVAVGIVDACAHPAGEACLASHSPSMLHCASHTAIHSKCVICMHVCRNRIPAHTRLRHCNWEAYTQKETKVDGSVAPP